MQENEGLCATCNNSPICYYRATRGPTLQCELFETWAPPVERNLGIKQSLSEVWAPGPASRPHGELPGLCSSCAHLEDCVYPKLNGGIWHCEEFA